MEMLTVISFVVFVCLAIWTLLAVRIFFNKKRVPGPLPVPILGTAYLCFYLLFNLSLVEDFFLKWSDLYGDIYGVWLFNQLVVQVLRPETIKVVLTSNTTRTPEFDYLHDLFGTGLLTSEGKKWEVRRKTISAYLHFSELKVYLSTYNKNANILCDQLRKTVGSPPFEVEQYLTKYTLDIACETFLGSEMGAQTGKATNYVEAWSRLSKLASVNDLQVTSLCYEFLDKLFGTKKIRDEYTVVARKFAMEMLEKKKKEFNTKQKDDKHNWIDTDDSGKKKYRSFLDEAVDKMNEKNCEFFQTDEDILEEITTLILTGSFTTAHLIGYILCTLAKYQKIQDKIYEELQEIGIDKYEVTYEQTLKMNYTKRVIQEVTRLYPVAPITGRTLTEDVVTEEGYVLPKGSIAYVNIFTLHRSPALYENPLEFNPDNFLPEKTSKRHQAAYIPFSFGPRNCIGQKVSMMVAKVALAKIILNYKVAYAGPEWDVQPVIGVVLDSKTGFHIKLEERK